MYSAIAEICKRWLKYSSDRRIILYSAIADMYIFRYRLAERISAAAKYIQLIAEFVFKQMARQRSPPVQQLYTAQ